MTKVLTTRMVGGLEAEVHVVETCEHKPDTKHHKGLHLTVRSAAHAVPECRPHDGYTTATNFSETLAATLARLGVDTGDAVVIGEVTLSGGVRHTRGIRVRVRAAIDAGYTEILVPYANRAEARGIDSGEGVRILCVSGVREAKHHFTGSKSVMLPQASYEPNRQRLLPAQRYGIDFSDMELSDDVRASVVDIVAGGHNFALIGSLGAGKTMLARRIMTLLEPTPTEQGEVDDIFSVAGLFGGDSHKGSVPFRAPHYTISDVGMLGNSERPGELSLAHNGVLLLDDVTSFKRSVIDILGTALRYGEMKITRRDKTIVWPAKPKHVVASFASCLCGFHQSTKHPNRCRCTEEMLERYNMRALEMCHRLGIQLKNFINVDVFDTDVVRLKRQAAGKHRTTSAEMRDEIEALRGEKCAS